MTLDKLIEICTPLHVTNDKYEGELSSFVLDSREVQENSVFIAIRGTEVDGHMFIEDAIARGAKAVICEESYYTQEDVCIIEVENTQKLTGPVAQAFNDYPARKLKVVGVTGTNGKTTTATLVYQVLSECDKKVSLLGTVNKRILNDVMDSELTTADPIELARDMKKMVEAGSEYLVMEVSSHALDQERVAGIDFEVAAFTNISHDHLDYHESLEEYSKTKKLLFDRLSESAAAVINMDDPYGAFMLEDCKARTLKLSFREGKAHILSNNVNGLSMVIDEVNIKSPLMGTFNAYNVGEAFLICKALGLSQNEITGALEEAKGAPGRMEPVSAPSSDMPTVIVDYAHTPDALRNVLSALTSVKNKKQTLFVVFGAGGDRDVAKRPEMAKAAEEFGDTILVTSDNPRTENPDLIIADILDGFEDLEPVRSITERDKAIQTAINEASDGDIVLIAGKGHEVYQEIDGKRHPFDDRKVAIEALHNKTGGGS